MGQVCVVADQVVRPNSLAFSADGAVAFITNTSVAVAVLGVNQTDMGTKCARRLRLECMSYWPRHCPRSYQYNVDPTSQQFANCRMLAHADAGIPDGIQVDVADNAYPTCADGVHMRPTSTAHVLLANHILPATHFIPATCVLHDNPWRAPPM
jgi:gluconolactonase